VIFQGEVPPQDIPFLLSAGDLLVHASYREGLARVLVQAMAAGIPAISSRAGGAAEIVVDGQNGYIFPIGGEKALKARLEAVTGDPELLSKLKEGARGTDVSDYSIDAMVKGTMAVYEKLR
jgi:glycosyltransferase involved in cell wall biosynthesis